MGFGFRTNFFFFFLILTVSVSAFSDYEQAGGDSQDYFSTSRSIFSLSMGLDYDWDPITVSKLSKFPLLSDIDGDGVIEIIVFGGGDLYIYNYSESLNNLFYEGSINVGQDTLYYSNPQIFDIDGDGDKEFLVTKRYEAGFPSMFYYISWNNTHFSKNNHTLSDLGLTAEDIMSHCGAEEQCFSIVLGTNATGQYIKGMTYNSSSSLIDTVQMEFGAPAGVDWCLPIQRVISYADYDADGDNEYISVVADPQNDVLRISYFYINSSNHITEENTITDGNYDSYTNDCSDGRFTFSSPLVTNIADTPGLETIVAVNTDESNPEYRMVAYTGSTLSEIGTYPSSSEVEGNIISMPYSTDLYSDTAAGEDFCTTGFNTISVLVDIVQRVSIVCGSAKHSGIKAREYIYDFALGETYNVTQTLDIHSFLTHSYEDHLSGTHVNFLTTFGVFSPQHAINSLSDYACQVVGATCDLNFYWVNPATEPSAYVPVDMDNDGYVEIFGVSNTTLRAFTDQRQNLGAQLEKVRILPDIEDDPVRSNSSVFIQVRASDMDVSLYGAGDNVSIRSILYLDNPNEQDTGWQNSSSSNYTATFFLTQADLGGFNKSVVSGVLRVMARDFMNPDLPDIQDYGFSVSENGTVYYGDGTEFIEHFITYLENGTGEGPGLTGSGCSFDSDCADSYFCNASNNCQNVEPSATDKADLRDKIAPPGLVPEQWRPLWALLIIGLAGVGVGSYLHKEHETDPRVWIMAVGGTIAGIYLISSWLGFLPAWPIFVMLVLAAGVFSLKFTPLGRGD